MVTFDKVLIGFKVGKIWKRNEWVTDPNGWLKWFTLRDEHDLELLTSEDVLADDWFEVMEH